jgi:hypothetical protein
MHGSTLKAVFAVIVGVGLSTASVAFAERVEKPHHFVPGTTIRSQEINQNFDVLYEHLNARLNEPPVIDGREIVVEDYDEATGSIPVYDPEGDPVGVTLLAHNFQNGLTADVSVDVDDKTWTLTPRGGRFALGSRFSGLVFSQSLAASDGQKSSSGVLRFRLPTGDVPGSRAPKVNFTYDGPDAEASFCEMQETNIGVSVTGSPELLPDLSGVRCHFGGSGSLEDIAGRVGDLVRLNLGAEVGAPGTTSATLTRDSELDSAYVKLSASVYPDGVIAAQPLRSQRFDVFGLVIGWSGAPESGFSVSSDAQDFSAPAATTSRRKVLVVMSVDGVVVEQAEVGHGEQRLFTPGQDGDYRVAIYAVNEIER